MQTILHPYRSSALKAKMALVFVALLCQAGGALAVGPYTVSTADSPAGGEVTDVATGLVWRRCSEGQTWSGTICLGTATTYTHERALVQAKSQAGWRLPNVKELASLADKTRANPAIDTAAFPATASSYYWTSSPDAGYTSFAWQVVFDSGGVGSISRSNYCYVRLVR